MPVSKTDSKQTKNKRAKHASVKRAQHAQREFPRNFCYPNTPRGQGFGRGPALTGWGDLYTSALAEAAHCNRYYLNAVLVGRRNATMTFMVQIAKLLKWDLNVLMKRIGKAKALRLKVTAKRAAKGEKNKSKKKVTKISRPKATRKVARKVSRKAAAAA